MKQTLFLAILKLLRPLIRILLRNGVPFGSFAEAARWVYVDVALKEFGIEGRKASDSRAAVVTGLTRKEVRRLKNIAEPCQVEMAANYNRAARVVSGWVRGRTYTDAAGSPLDLPIEGEDEATFSGLVKKHGGDVPVRAVLDELSRVGTVSLAGDGKVRLLERAYVPHTGEEEKTAILGTDVADLINTIDINLKRAGGAPRFQRKVAYDNVPGEAVAPFRKMSAERAQRLLEQLDRYLAEHDRDTHPGLQGTGRCRVGLGIYYFEEDLEPAPGEGKQEGD